MNRVFGVAVPEIVLDQPWVILLVRQDYQRRYDAPTMAAKHTQGKKGLTREAVGMRFDSHGLTLP